MAAKTLVLPLISLTQDLFLRDEGAGEMMLFKLLHRSDVCVTSSRIIRAREVELYVRYWQNQKRRAALQRTLVFGLSPV